MYEVQWREKGERGVEEEQGSASPRYETIRLLSDGKFQRCTGVKKELFLKMRDIVQEADRVKKARGGRKSTLCVEDRLLMALEYLREYRTYFHVGVNYGMSESTTYKIIKWIEDVLIKHPEFTLPGKKALHQGDIQDNVLLIDATECAIERPKKTNDATTPGRRNGTR